jgi:hypothetical protein
MRGIGECSGRQLGDSVAVLSLSPFRFYFSLVIVFLLGFLHSLSRFPPLFSFLPAVPPSATEAP